MYNNIIRHLLYISLFPHIDISTGETGEIKSAPYATGVRVLSSTMHASADPSDRKKRKRTKKVSSARPYIYVCVCLKYLKWLTALTVDDMNAFLLECTKERG